MRISKLTINNLRNIKNADIIPGKGINIFQGSNGAGKTTVLESIYLLARARAIKSTQHKNLINHTENELTVFSELLSNSGHTTRLGIRKDKSNTLVKKNGESVARLTDLARILPIANITPNIQRLLEEGPVHRRKLLNWGLFHVEPTFGAVISRYNQVLKQRNALLGKRTADLTVWTQYLSKSGEEVNKLQTSYLEKWKSEVNELLTLVPQLEGLQLMLVKGWRQGMSLQESLEHNLRTDQERHFTSVGPHRMDIKITFHGQEIRDQFSRGQKKIVSVLFILAQARLLDKFGNEPPVLLIDDLHAELDHETYKSLLQQITNMQYQTFLTRLSPENSDFGMSPLGSMFHVEQGNVTPD
ncbi:MAG: DNA replication/repair protein RecF [Candidatus Thiodiazotropha sp.]